MIKGALKKALKGMGYELRQPGDGWYSVRQWDDVYRNNYSADALTNRRLYNVGAAGFYHWAWTNIDKTTQTYERRQKAVMIDYDLLDCTPLEIEDGKGEVVYTSHTIEHVTDEAVDNLFREAYRILKPGGYIRVTCPNADLPHRAWLEGDRDYFYWQYAYSNPTEMQEGNYVQPLKEVSLEQLFLSTFACNASEIHAHHVTRPISDQEVRDVFKNKAYEEALDWCKARTDLEIQKKYPNSHINWWNPGKVTRLLREAGFSNPHVSSYGQSFCPVLRDTSLFDNTHPKMSLYVEAVKA